MPETKKVLSAQPELVSARSAARCLSSRGITSIKSALIGSVLLSFVASFDDVPLSFFLTGRDNTLPIFIYSAMWHRLPPEINAIMVIIRFILVAPVAPFLLILTRDYRMSKRPSGLAPNGCSLGLGPCRASWARSKLAEVISQTKRVHRNP